jgi:hypothetical protein
MLACLRYSLLTYLQETICIGGLTPSQSFVIQRENPSAWSASSHANLLQKERYQLVSSFCFISIYRASCFFDYE